MSNKVYIYVLKEKGSDEVKYVGQTIDPHTRLSGHRNSAKIDSTNPKSAWIAEVHSRGGTVELEVIEECDFSDAGKREAFWMKYYRGKGVSLTNVGTAQQRRIRYAPVVSVSHKIDFFDSNEFDSGAPNEISERLERIDAKIDRLIEIITTRKKNGQPIIPIEKKDEWMQLRKEWGLIQ